MAEDRLVFFGIGAQDAGVDRIHDHLRGHSQVFVPDLPEPNFFWAKQERREAAEIGRVMGKLQTMLAGEDGDRGAALVHGAARVGDAAKLIAALAGRADYLDLFSPAPAGTCAVGEISPAYAMLTEATFREMAAIAPETRFFLVMRDPVERFWAAIRTLVTRQPAMLEGGSIARIYERMLFNPDSHLRRMTDYAATIRALEVAVPATRIHYLFFEDLNSDRGVETLRELEVFLGLDHCEAATRIPVRRAPEIRPGPAELSDGMRRAAEAVFAPTYAALLDRFGGRLPPEWATPGAGNVFAVA